MRNRDYYERIARQDWTQRLTTGVLVMSIVGLLALALYTLVTEATNASEPVGRVVQRGSTQGVRSTTRWAGKVPIRSESEFTDYWVIVEAADGKQHTRNIDSRLWQYVRIGDGWPTLDAGK